MPRLTIAPAARDDLRDLRRYSKSAFGPPATMAYLEGLRVPFDAVLSRPLAGRSEPDLGDAMRSVGFRSHRLYYRVEPFGILIVRILHRAQDIGRVFGGER